MGADLKINGLDELRTALRKLPAELVSDASPIVQAAGQAAAASITAAYPQGPTGNLRRGVRVDAQVDAVSSVVRVRSTAHHAYLYESGSSPRHWKNGKNTGQMPAAHVFIPIAIAQRAVMVGRLIDLVERAGLTVAAA